jgi:hypothetical protein
LLQVVISSISATVIESITPRGLNILELIRFHSFRLKKLRESGTRAQHRNRRSPIPIFLPTQTRQHFTVIMEGDSAEFGDVPLDDDEDIITNDDTNRQAESNSTMRPLSEKDSATANTLLPHTKEDETAVVYNATSSEKETTNASLIPTLTNESNYPKAILQDASTTEPELIQESDNADSNQSVNTTITAATSALVIDTSQLSSFSSNESIKDETVNATIVKSTMSPSHSDTTEKENQRNQATSQHDDKPSSSHAAISPTQQHESAESLLEVCLFGRTIHPPLHESGDMDDSYDDNHRRHHHHHRGHVESVAIPYSDLSGTVDLVQLRKCASHGIPEEDSWRGLTWRILTGLVPLERSHWLSALTPRREWYNESVQTWFESTTDTIHGTALSWQPRRMPTAAADAQSSEELTITNSNETPVSVPYEAPPIPKALIEEWKQKGKDLHVLINVMKGWNALKWTALQPDDKDTTSNSATLMHDFIDSATLLDEIRKDVVRTHSDLSFFLEPPDVGRRRYAALERILFIYAKHHPGISYVQGMNEIVGALYYVLARDAHTEWSRYAEADTYALLEWLMADLRDVFVPALDQAESGIQGRLQALEALLRKHDPQVQEHLQDIGIDVSFFAIRWWTTLLSREFLLPDTIRLWDSMLASTHKDNFLRYVCVTMVMMIRHDLLQADFSHGLRLLQAYPSTHMDRLLEASRALWMYESQVTLACHKGHITLSHALTILRPPPTLIMAYGLPSGRLLSSSESAAAAASNSPKWPEQTWKEAKEAVTTSAQGWLGKASRFMHKYQTQWTTSQSKLAEDEEEKDTDDLPPALEVTPITPEDDIYLNAIRSVEEPL